MYTIPWISAHKLIFYCRPRDPCDYIRQEMHIHVDQHHRTLAKDVVNANPSPVLFPGEEGDEKGVQVNLYHIRNLIIDQDDRYRVL